MTARDLSQRRLKILKARYCILRKTTRKKSRNIFPAIAGLDNMPIRYYDSSRIVFVLIYPFPACS